MPEALQTADPIHDAERIPDYSRLSYSEIGLILKLEADGKTQTYIAQQLGCSQPTVSRVLSELRDTTGLARKRLNNLALKAANKLDEAMDAAAEQGKSGPMDSVLKATGLLGHDVSGGVTVICGGDVGDVLIVSPGPHSLSPSVSDDMHRLSADSTST